MNIWIILSGILTVYISTAHIIYGEKVLMQYFTNMNDSIKSAFRISWYQSGVVLLISGGSLVLYGFNILKITGIFEYFLVGILIIYFIILFLFLIFKYRIIFKDRMIPLIILVIIIIFNIIGIVFN